MSDEDPHDEPLDDPHDAATTSAFEQATGVEPIAAANDTGARRYGGEVHEGWDVGGAANGGYMMALAVRAMAAATERQPLTVTAHYLAPGVPGRCVIDVATVRTGRRLTTVDALLTQGDKAVIKLVGTFGNRDATSGGATSLPAPAPPLDLPPFEACLALRGGANPIGLPERLDVRIRPGDEGFAVGSPTGQAELTGWFAFADSASSRLDPFAVILATDAFFPAIFNSGIDPGWVPTIELTVHLRADPAPGPLAAHFHTDVVGSGLLNEDGVLWDGDGTVVAQSRQLALMPR